MPVRPSLLPPCSQSVPSCSCSPLTLLPIERCIGKSTCTYIAIYQPLQYAILSHFHAICLKKWNEQSLVLVTAFWNFFVTVGPIVRFTKNPPCKHSGSRMVSRANRMVSSGPVRDLLSVSSGPDHGPQFIAGALCPAASCCASGSMHLLPRPSPSLLQVGRGHNFSSNRILIFRLCLWIGMTMGSMFSWSPSCVYA